MPSVKKKQETPRDSINSRDVAASMIQIVKDGKGPNTMIVIRYNVKGVSDENSKTKFSDEETCAVRMTVGRKVTHKVRTQRGGRFYDPTKNGPSYGLTKRDKATNEPMFDLRPVSPKAFEAYVRFLQTRYETYLISAEREV